MGQLKHTHIINFVVLKQSWNATACPGEMLNVTIRKTFLDFVATTVTLRPPVKPGTPSDLELSRENYSWYLPVGD
jgi:hypothetical protein